MKSTLGGTWRVAPLAAAVGRCRSDLCGVAPAACVAFVPGRLAFVRFLSVDGAFVPCLAFPALHKFGVAHMPELAGHPTGWQLAGHPELGSGVCRRPGHGHPHARRVCRALSFLA